MKWRTMEGSSNWTNIYIRKWYDLILMKILAFPFFAVEIEEVSSLFVMFTTNDDYETWTDFFTGAF